MDLRTVHEDGRGQGKEDEMKIWLETPDRDEGLVVDIGEGGNPVEVDGQVYTRADEFVWIDEDWLEVWHPQPSDKG